MKNGIIVDRDTEEEKGSYYDGGGETIDNTGPCPSHRYREAQLIRGYLPGEYNFAVSNANTSSPVSSPLFIVES